MFNMQQMMQKAQKMQKKMAELQEEAGQIEVQGQAGGGLVKITMTCKGMMKKIDLDQSALADKEMLEDMILAACNDARAKADQTMADATQKAMNDMGIPPGMLGGGMPF